MQCSQCGRSLGELVEFCHACGRQVEKSNGVAARKNEWPITDTAEAGYPRDDASLLEHGHLPVARFRSAAEAGYFADELSRVGEWPLALSLEESCDPVGHYWTTRFVLSAPPQHAAAVTQALSELVKQSDEDGQFEPASDGLGLSADADEAEADAESGVHWIPIVLTLAAGSAVLWAAKSWQERPKREVRLAPVGARHVDLWERLADGPEPWIQQSDDGGLRVLTIDGDHGAGLLKEDADGDGVFERTWRIRREAVPQ